MVTDTAVPAVFSFSPHPRNRFSRACPPVQISPPVTKAHSRFFHRGEGLAFWLT